MVSVARLADNLHERSLPRVPHKSTNPQHGKPGRKIRSPYPNITPEFDANYEASLKHGSVDSEDILAALLGSLMYGLKKTWGSTTITIDRLGLQHHSPSS